VTGSRPTIATAVGSRANGTFPAATASLVAIVIVLVAIDVTLVPYVLREGATDWAAYDYASGLLDLNQNPYAWASAPDIRAITTYPYLYPPPLAWIWGLGLNPQLWLTVKVASLAGLGAFAWRYAATTPVRLALAAVLVVLALATPSVVHDLVLGNVMVLYLGAIAVVCAYPERRWAVVPLGILIAIAFKPLVATIVVWLLVRERARFFDLVGVAVGLTIVFALVIGPSVYIDYLIALPKLGGLAQPFSGNLGLSGISQPLALAAIPLALAWAAFAAWRLVREAGLATAVALTLLVQPTLGFNYACLLIPALILLWRVHRPTGLIVALLALIASPISPPLAGLIVAVAASIVGRRPESERARTAIAGAAPA
jgi:hypothetical protein